METPEILPRKRLRASGFADHEVRRMLTTGELSPIRRGRYLRGAPVARRVPAFADERADGPGESRSRVAMARNGIPAPQLQWEVRSQRWESIATVDFAWPERRTVAEFDGEITYGRLLRPGQTTGDVLFAEKRREDAIRDRRWGVVRWCWDDLPDFATIAARLRRSFDRPV